MLDRLKRDPRTRRIPVQVVSVDRMRGASQGKTMYVIPYLMSPPGNELAPWATGVQVTDTRTVVLHILRMARVGAEHVNDAGDQFVRAVERDQKVKRNEDAIRRARQQLLGPGAR